MVWPEDQQKYLGKYMAGYESIRKARYKKQLELIDENYPLSAPTYEDWESLSEDEKLVRDSIMATHAAMVDRVDQNIGRILERLEDIDKLDNTLILFLPEKIRDFPHNSTILSFTTLQNQLKVVFPIYYTPFPFIWQIIWQIPGNG